MAVKCRTGKLTAVPHRHLEVTMRMIFFTVMLAASDSQTRQLRLIEEPLIL